MAKKRTPVSAKTFKAKTFSTRLYDQQRRRLNAEKRKTEQKQKDEWIRFVKSIPAIIAGKSPIRKPRDKKIYRAFWSAVSLSLFTDIYEGYEIKSQGLPDETGDMWKDLSPFTKAYKRDRKKNAQGKMSRSLSKRLERKDRRNLANEGTMGLLTPAQYTQWKKDFAKKLIGLQRARRSPLSLAKAKEKAAKHAWYMAKKKGARTLYDVLGNQHIPIMRDTDAIFESLKPGKVMKDLMYKKGAKEQIHILSGGTLTIGTRVKHAKVAEGPREWHRPLWPKKLGVWYDRAIQAGRDAVAKELKSIAKDAGK